MKKEYEELIFEIVYFSQDVCAGSPDVDHAWFGSSDKDNWDFDIDW